MDEPNSQNSNAILSLSRLPIVPPCEGTAKSSIFISYSWDSREHQEWIAVLARKMTELGISVTVDINHTGESTFSDFMDSGINDNRFVICVLSSSYVQKISSKQNSGVRYEFAGIKRRCRTKEALESFVIPIIKDNTIDPFPDKIPLELRDIDSWNFDSIEDAPYHFAKIMARLLSLDKFLYNIQRRLSREVAQDISDRFYTLVANFWNAVLSSEEAKKLRDEILAIFSTSNEQTTIAYQNSDIRIDQNQFGKVCNSIGKWDESCDGDQEIIAFLAGENKDE